MNILRKDTLMTFLFLWACCRMISAQDIKKTDIQVCWLSNNRIDAPITIQIHNQNRILYYEQTDEVKCLTVTIEINKTDTLSIFVKTESLSGSKIIHPDSVGLIFVDLTPLPKNMEEIIIQPNGYSKKGDTTSYAIDFYLKANHQVLKDLLNNIPYFIQNDDGSITYKGKKISSIMIQGEEVFSDQLRLLTNHIPVHVLKSIELIENNPSHPLLKGIEKSSTVVMNLSVKEKYRGKLWGTLFSGYGNDERFEISPVIFSLRTKMKIGLIGKSYSGGTILDKAEQIQLKTSNLLLLQQLTGQSPGIIVPIANTGRYFSRNKMSDHRIQLTNNLNQYSNMKLEARLMKSHFMQQTDYLINRISDSLIKTQNWISKKDWKPVHLSIKLNYAWEKQMNSISLSFNWQKEMDQPDENSRFSEQSASFLYYQKQRQSYDTKSAEIIRIKKNNNRFAKKLTARIESTSFKGNAAHVLPQEFGLIIEDSETQTNFNQLNRLNLTTLNARYEKINAVNNKRIQPIKWNIDWKQLYLFSNLICYDESSLIPPIQLSKYQCKGNFGTGRIYAETTSDRKKKNGFEKYFFQAGAGFYMINAKSLITGLIVRPIFQIQRETESVIRKYGTFGTSIQLTEGETDILKLNQCLIPNQGLNYTSFTKPVLQNRSFFGSISFRGRTGKRALPQCELSAFIQYYSPVYKTIIQGPLTETYVQMIPRPNSTITLSSHLQWLTGNRLPAINTSARLGVQENFFMLGNKIKKIRTGFLHTEFNSDWQVRPAFRLGLCIKIDYRFFSENQFKEQLPYTGNLIFRNNIKLGWQWKEKVFIECSGMINVNNFRKWVLQKAIFSDLSFRYMLKKNINIYIDVYNLLNISDFNLSDQNPGFMQSRLSIPLVPRHFLTGFKWIF
jgi:hypothetical protein